MAEKGAEFGVLGPLQIRVDGEPVALGTPKQRAVLAMLVINRNRPVREGVVDRCGRGSEDSPPADPRRTACTSYVANLRKVLAGIRRRRPARRWPARRPGYQADGARQRPAIMGRFSARARPPGVQAAATGKFEQASQYLSAALAEWRGPVLEDLRDFQFVDAFATALVEDKMLAHTALAEAEIACGRSYAVIGELESLTAEHPDREPLWAQLITAYYLAERQSDALEAYRRL